MGRPSCHSLQTTEEHDAETGEQNSTLSLPWMVKMDSQMLEMHAGGTSGGRAEMSCLESWDIPDKNGYGAPRGCPIKRESWDVASAGRANLLDDVGELRITRVQARIVFERVVACLLFLQSVTQIVVPAAFVS